MLNVIKYEDLRDIVLVGHSYGGMVATGVADRARDKVKQLIYIDAFVPKDGQSLLDLYEADRPRDAGTGEERRRLAGAAQSDAAGYVAGRRRMAERAPRPYADQMFRDKAQAAGRRADLAAQLYLRHAHHAGRHFRAVREHAKSDPAWRYYEIDASHSPNVTAPEALMALLQKIAA